MFTMIAKLDKGNGKFRRVRGKVDATNASDAAAQAIPALTKTLRDNGENLDSVVLVLFKKEGGETSFTLGEEKAPSKRPRKENGKAPAKAATTK